MKSDIDKASVFLQETSQALDDFEFGEIIPPPRAFIPFFPDAVFKPGLRAEFP